MNRTQSAIAALGVALAVFATGWAIGVNSGIFNDGPRHEPVSARSEVTGSMVPGYGDLPQGTTSPTESSWHEDWDQAGEHYGDDHDDWDEHELRKERANKKSRDREREEHHDDD